MTKAIFFDLETTGLSTIGQILNYAFVCVDEDFNEIETLHDKIELSSINIIEPYAWRANRVKISDYTKGRADSEYTACQKIYKFLQKHSKEGKTYLIGQNNSNFDNHWIKTTLIRNGLNPYALRNLISRDMKHLSKYLFFEEPNFRNLLLDNPPERKLFSLEHTTTKLDILIGEQTHESLDDTILTVNLAKAYKDLYDRSIFDFEPYEPLDTAYGKHKVIMAKVVDYDTLTVKEDPYYLVDIARGGALWCNLNKFFNPNIKDKRNSIFWANRKSSFFTGNPVDKKAYSRQIKDFEFYLKKHNPSWKHYGKFFGKSNIDVEAHIYQFPFSEIDKLRLAISSGDPSSLSDKGKQLYSRFILRNYSTSDYKDLCTKYMDYRYFSNQMVIKKEEVSTSWGTIKNTYSEVKESIKELGSESYYKNSEKFLKSLGLV